MALATVSTIGSGLSGIATAQDAEQSTQSSGVIEDVVVTAQRREQSLQDVPITVGAYTADTLKTQGVTNAADISMATPGVTITRTLGSPQIYIRGVGTQNNAAGDESSNSVYVDGVYMSSLPAGFLGFNNIERVEVLRGPQGTLFGRNATGGLIQIVTREPSHTPTLDTSIGYGNYDTYDANLYGSTGLTQNLAGDIALRYNDQREGFGKNYFNGKDVGASEEFGARTSFRWDASENTSVKVALDYSDIEETQSVARQVIYGAVAAGGLTHVGGWWDINSDAPITNKVESYGGSVHVTHEMENFNFVSISAARRFDWMYVADQDSTPSLISTGSPDATQKQYSQEFQLQSGKNAPFEWIAGLFYFSNDTDQILTFSGSSQAAVGGRLDRVGSMDTKSYAAYGQATFNLTDKTRLTTGVRYTVDQRDLVARDETPVGTRNIVNKDEEWSEPTWHLALDHRLTDDVLLFGSYSRGFKSGVFNLNNQVVPPVDPEILDAYELGVKSDWLDGRLRLNVSGFYYDYSDIQLVVRIAGASQILNAAEAEVYGMDAELLAMPVDGLTLRGGLNLLKGEYTAFPNAPGTLPSPATCGPPPAVTPGPRTGGNTTCTIDATGNDMIRAPEITLNVGATYAWATSAGTLTFDTSYYYNDGFYFEPDNRVRQGAYNNLTAQLSWALPDESWRVRVWGKNLLEEKYWYQVSTSLGDAGTPAPPMTFGISFEVHR